MISSVHYSGIGRVFPESWQSCVGAVLYDSMTGYTVGTEGWTKGSKAVNTDVGHSVYTFGSQFN